MRVAPAGGARLTTSPRTAGRLLLAMLGVSMVGLLGIAIWASTSGPAAVPHKIAPPVPAPAPAGARAAQQVRTSTVHGSKGGYDATVRITQADVPGSTKVTTLDVALSTQSTPASAPTASARLIGADHVAHVFALTIVGAGHWTSNQLAIPAGRYALTFRVDRNGGPIQVPMTAVLT